MKDKLLTDKCYTKNLLSETFHVYIFCAPYFYFLEFDGQISELLQECAQILSDNLAKNHNRKMKIYFVIIDDMDHELNNTSHTSFQKFNQYV